MKEVACYFLQYDVDILPVVDMNNSFIGYIGKNQLYKSIGEGINPDTPVQKLMISNLMSVAPEIELEEIYPLTNSIMPIIKDKKILGLITRKAIVSYSNLDIGNISGQTEEAFNAIYNGIIAIDREDKILIFNKAAEDLFNIDRSSVLNRPYHEVFPTGKLHQILENKKSASNHKFSHDHKTLLAMNSPIMVAGQVIGAVSSIQDISKLEHVSDELKYTKKLKAEVDAIIEASFDSIFVTDAKANVLS
ncbi:MAG TPA: hypothetical protein DDY59_01270, partial [Lachnospiraceae bacterium]|nr:hypothetical protein [Lachnospiraceae bacterium]